LIHVSNGNAFGAAFVDRAASEKKSLSGSAGRACCYNIDGNKEAATAAKIAAGRHKQNAPCLSCGLLS
jgi:hypothetical protein